MAPDLSKSSVRKSQKSEPREDPIRLHSNLLNAIPAALIATDIAGKIIYWNRVAEKLYGWLACEVLGRNILEITVPPDSEKQAAEIMSLLTAGLSWTGEFKVKRRDGICFTAMVTDSPVFDVNGVMIGIIGVSLDLSARKRAEEAYRKANQQLELRVKRRTQQLKAANENLRELSGRLLQLQDEERRRIARELHDSVGQLLAAISMNTVTIKAESKKLSPAAAEALSHNSKMVDEILGQTRTISHLLHPPLLDEAGLASALDWYVNGFSQRSNIDVSLDMPTDLGRLSRELELTIFRVVQESLTNIHRHSGSRTAAIRITREDTLLSVQIKDTGQGMCQTKAKAITGASSGVGLRGMRERLAQVGGDLTLESDGNGTLVTAILPLDKSTRNTKREPLTGTASVVSPPIV
jgi:PAS domain S-box-containing protein